jgi:hypothetical protein
MNAATINRVAVLVDLSDLYTYIICEDQETSRLQETTCSDMMDQRHEFHSDVSKRLT